jgi:hypothetical protein
VIGDLNIVGVGLLPLKTKPPLFVDSYAVLSEAVPFERFQPVARHCCERVERAAAFSICSFLIAALVKF